MVIGDSSPLTAAIVASSMIPSPSAVEPVEIFSPPSAIWPDAWRSASVARRPISIAFSADASAALDVARAPGEEAPRKLEIALGIALGSVREQLLAPPEPGHRDRWLALEVIHLSEADRDVGRAVLVVRCEVCLEGALLGLDLLLAVAREERRLGEGLEVGAGRAASAPRPR